MYEAAQHARHTCSIDAARALPPAAHTRSRYAVRNDKCEVVVLCRRDRLVQIRIARSPNRSRTLRPACRVKDPTALAELSSRCELDFLPQPGAWKMFDSNALLDRQNKGRLDSYVFIELEIYKELESGRCTIGSLERLWELRDRSLELFYPAGYELQTLRAVLESQRRA